MTSFLNALFGAGDADVGARVVRAWNSDLCCRLQLQLLQLVSVFTNDKAMVFLRDSNCS